MNQSNNTPAAETIETTPIVYAGLFRRLFAIFYDGFLLLAILFVVSQITTTLNHGIAIKPSDTFYPLFVFTLFSLSYLYFAWFWINQGQSLGMKTWHLQLQTTDNSAITWKTTAIRFISAIVSWGACGLGFLWSFIDKNNRCWHDISSNTVLIDLRPQK